MIAGPSEPTVRFSHRVSDPDSRICCEKRKTGRMGTFFASGNGWECPCRYIRQSARDTRFLIENQT